MLSSEQFILSVSTLTGSHEITLTKQVALTPQEQILLKHMFFKEKRIPKRRNCRVVCIKKKLIPICSLADDLDY